jgi:hypothetical protein
VCGTDGIDGAHLWLAATCDFMGLPLASVAVVLRYRLDSQDGILGNGLRPQLHLYDDHASGIRDDRPGLIHCLKALREGDTLVV